MLADLENYHIRSIRSGIAKYHIAWPPKYRSKVGSHKCGVRFDILTLMVQKYQKNQALSQHQNLTLWERP